jgi:pimeloyl-ACP methyl ester carboxylesterase
MAGGSLPNWAWVQSDIARKARVCSYDRAGSGWSDPGPKAMGLHETAEDLHALLTRAGIAGPYVLVGHSKGGLIVRQFASDHPEQVVGIVLVDAAHPDQFDLHPEYLNETEEMMPLLRWTPLLARLGLMRLYATDGFDFGDLPARQKAELIAEWSAPKHWEGEVPNLGNLQAFFEEAQSLGDLGDLPLAVISAGENTAAGWDELQDDLASLSTNSFHETIEGASHASLAFNPEHARATSQAILRLLELAGAVGSD